MNETFYTFSSIIIIEERRKNSIILLLRDINVTKHLSNEIEMWQPRIIGFLLGKIIKWQKYSGLIFFFSGKKLKNYRIDLTIKSSEVEKKCFTQRNC